MANRIGEVRVAARIGRAQIGRGEQLLLPWWIPSTVRPYNTYRKFIRILAYLPYVGQFIALFCFIYLLLIGPVTIICLPVMFFLVPLRRAAKRKLLLRL